MQAFYDKLADILEVDSVGPDDVLEDFEEWDSLAVLSVIAMMDADFKVNVGNAIIRTIRTAGDLEKALLERMDRADG